MVINKGNSTQSYQPTGRCKINPQVSQSHWKMSSKRDRRNKVLKWR